MRRSQGYNFEILLQPNSVSLSFSLLERLEKLFLLQFLFARTTAFIKLIMMVVVRCTLNALSLL